MSYSSPLEMLQALQQPAAYVDDETLGTMIATRGRQSGISMGAIAQAINNGKQFGSASELGRAARGALGVAAGAQASRWSGQASGRPVGEDYGLAKWTTASGSTGAEVAFSFTTEEPLEGLVLYLWDPAARLLAAYISELKADSAVLSLSPTENFEFLPVQCVILDDALGEARSTGGLYIGDVDKDTTIEGSIYIPTSDEDVVWGWVGRCLRPEPPQVRVASGRSRGGSMFSYPSGGRR